MTNPLQHLTPPRIRRRLRPAHLALLVGAALAPCGPAAADCPAFTIVRGAAGLAIERVDIAEGQTEVFAPGSDVLALVVPVGVGQSGDFVRRADAPALTARCAAGTLRVSVARGGAVREVMAQPVEALRRLAVTVCATGHDGARARWRIDGWSRAVREDGPVIDLFAGAIPMAEGDLSITTVTEDAPPVAPAPHLSGSAALRFEEGYPIVDLVIGGTTRRALVDLAAASSMIARRAVPAGVAVRPATMGKVSADGATAQPLSVGAAGGSVAGFDEATVPALAIGSARFADAALLVLDTLPAVAGKPLDAIVGLDLLQRAGSVRFARAPGAGGTWALDLGSAPAAARPTPDADVALRAAGALRGIDATVGGHGVFLVLDSGTPHTVVSTRAAREASLRLTDAPGPAPRGLDGKPLAMRLGRAAALGVGSVALGPLDVRVADLPVLAKLDASGPIGLLGADVIARCSVFEVDLAGGRVRIWK